MDRSKYPLYAVAVLAVGALVLWAGLPPIWLLLLVVCPLVMFFMMRGMHGGNQAGNQAGNQGGGHGSHFQADAARDDSRATHPSDLDGSHERIDRP